MLCAKCVCVRACVFCMAPCWREHCCPPPVHSECIWPDFTNRALHSINHHMQTKAQQSSMTHDVDTKRLQLPATASLVGVLPAAGRQPQMAAG